MKDKLKRKHYKKGMTYVEVLVALSILALIVVVFTPVLMYSYENLYRAGEINVDTYEIKSYIEESLAVRSDDPKLKTQFGLQGISDQLNVVMRRIKSSVNGLETMYGLPREGVSILGDDVLIDDTSTHEITIQFTDFEGLSNGSFVKSGSPGKDQIAYIIETPLMTPTNLDYSKYSLSYDDSTNSATLTIKGVDITYSPLKIIVRYSGINGGTKTVDKYINIKPATMMFVGAADGTTDYYTTAGFDENNVFSLEARKMSGGGVTSGTSFNKITWVTTGADNTGPVGYYAMCGNDGVIRRLWKEIEGGYNKYAWSGDNTEVYTYGADFNGTAKTVSNQGGVKEVTNKPTTAATYINYNGLYLNSGISVKNCIQISNNISTNAAATLYKNQESKEGMYFYTASEENTYTGITASLRKEWKVNWEDDDSMTAWDISAAGVKQYQKHVFANYIVGSIRNAHHGNNKQPILFFATSTAGNKDATSTDGVSNKGGRAKVTDDTKQIDAMFLMTDNQSGWYYSYHKAWWYWVIKNSSGTITDYASGRDTAATFTELPVYPAANGVKFYNAPNGTVPDIENGPFTETQKKMLRYIINNFSDGVRVLNSETKSLIGKTDITALDNNIPYVRLKCYSNVKASNLNAAFASLTAESSYKTAALNNIINNQNASSILSTINTATSLTLTDMCTLDTGGGEGEEKIVNYTGYSPALAYIYSTVLTNVHKDGSGNNSAEQGYIKPYVIMGTGGSSYSIAELPVISSDHYRNQSTLPTGTKTGTDTDTAFTLGYSSNRGLLFTYNKTLEEKYKFQSTNVEDDSLQFPDEFTSYLSYAQDGEITLAVGYTTKGSVEIGKLSTAGGCSDHGLTSAQTGHSPIYINQAFFYNTADSARGNHSENSQTAQIAFKNANEDINLGSAYNKPYCRGYYLEAANPNQSSGSPTSFVLQKTKCAATYTKLGYEEGSSTTQSITNAGVIAMHFAGDSSFRTIFVAPSTDARLKDSRFTCAAVGTTTVAVGENVSTFYKAYIGDSKGNVWCIPQFQKTDTYVALSSYTVGTTLLDSNGTGMSSIKKIYLSGNRLVIIGETTDNKKTKMIVIEQSLVDPNDPEGALKPPEIVVNTTLNYTLYDISEYNGIFYAVGTTPAGAGVILHTTNPTQGWTPITSAKNKDGNIVALKPLYSFATTGNTEKN